MSDAEKQDTPEQAEFRTHCQQWLAENHPRPTIRTYPAGRTGT